MRLPNFRNDVSALIELLPESAVVVELGSFAGASARSFLGSPKIKRLFCVDRWEAGYDAADLASGADMQAAEQAFDDIRKKYRADREFKQTVDRYISEFERLLEEVSRDDRGQVVARTYLTSETGKVYTMLAHAAGRFD